MKKTLSIKIKYHSKELPKLNKVDKGDWIDLYVGEDYTMKAGELLLLNLGVSMKLPENYEAHIIPRSSTFLKYGILQANSMGMVDNSYCGNEDIWKFPAYATRDVSVSKGDRLCQFRIVEKQPKINFEEVENLEDLNRGGFGSTGK
jgi:dUTP pyrophosphatase